MKSLNVNRIWSISVGISGGFLLYNSLAPVFLSGVNSALIGQWRDVVLAWDGFVGYLKVMLAAGTLSIAGLGIIGVVINIFKPNIGNKLMLWGGIAALIFFAALWLGFFDIQDPFFGSSDIRSHLVWGRGWQIANWSVSEEILNFFGGGWHRPAIVGAILLISTNLPKWWSRLS